MAHFEMWDLEQACVTGDGGRFGLDAFPLLIGALKNISKWKGMYICTLLKIMLFF